MIQFNLLPDVKIEYIKAQNMRRMTTSVSVVVALVALVVLGLSFTYNALQKKHLADLTRDIAAESRQLQSKPQIDRVLTVQNQLQSLTALHDAKPAASRLFGYLNQVTPDKASINSFTTDFGAHTATIIGNADSLATVNKFVDTLKFTDFQIKGDQAKKPAFSQVVLESFGYSNDAKGATATYTITLTNDTTIFDITKEVALIVPADKVTTRSQVDKPDPLFKDGPKPQTPPSSSATTPKPGGTR